MATIKQLRIERGMTQETLANRAGISFPTLNRIEKGKRPCYQSTLRAIAGALNVSVEDIEGVNVRMKR